MLNIHEFETVVSEIFDSCHTQEQLIGRKMQLNDAIKNVYNIKTQHKKILIRLRKEKKGKLNEQRTKT